MSDNKKLDDWKIPLYKIYTDDEDVDVITKIIKRGSRWAIGPEIEEFESALKKFIGVDYCLTLNSGTSALDAALLAYDINQKHDVIVPSFTFVATANSVMNVNANPLFVDIEESTLGLDPELLSKHITEKTKAVIPVDYAGLSCKIFDILEIAKANHMLVIEDAAEALGSKINDKQVGSQADIAIFSFCGNKVLTTGEGGAIATNDREIFEKIKLIRSHGRIDKTNYFETTSGSEYVETGHNWRMSTITAVLGLSQLGKLEQLIKKRRDNAEYISSRLSKFSQIITPSEPSGYEHIFQMYTIRLPNKQIRDSLHDFLIKKRIFSKVYFEPIHQMSLYRKKNSEILPITEKISEQVLTLPMYPNMEKDEKDYLIDSISEFFETL